MEERTETEFPDALADLMISKGYSFRALAERTAPYRTSDMEARRGVALSATYLSELRQRKTQPTIENMVAIARAAEVDPEYFLEYRQHVAADRARELVKTIGLAGVMRALELAEPYDPAEELEAELAAAGRQRRKRDGSTARTVDAPRRVGRDQAP